MRIIEHISLDGVIQVSGEDDDFPHGDWTAPYRTPAGREAMPSGVILSTYTIAGPLKTG